MGDTVTPSPSALVLGAGAGLALLAAALVSTLLAVLAGTGGCAPPAIQAAPGVAAETIPARYPQLYGTSELATTCRQVTAFPAPP